MVQKLFWQDPYLTSLKTRISAVDENKIQLESTIFYAESGGQESDAGTIGGLEVVRAQKQGKQIIYYLSEVPSFKQGDQVDVTIDWPRRYALMKLHFAAEVVLELFTKLHPHLAKTGAHISENKSRIDFSSASSIKPLLSDIELKAQSMIDADLCIESAFSDIENQHRYWQVEGFAKVPCGGTHLKRTGEVGKISLKRKNLGKGKERVEIRLLEEDANSSVGI